MSELKKSKY